MTRIKSAMKNHRRIEMERMRYYMKKNELKELEVL